jgi:DNA primase small subunit
MLARQPIRMEIGAVFSHPPKNHNAVVKDAYKPCERELVFDIDMDDYDDIRTCCSGAKICRKCWTFITAAVKSLDRALRDDFGFKHILFVYSGRRGVHCWVCDQGARKLSNEHRAAVAEYLSLVTGGSQKARAEIRMNGCDEIHPSVVEATKICEYYFRDDPDGVLQGQDILRKGPHLTNILEALLPAERDSVSKFVTEHPQATSGEIWAQIEQLEPKRRLNARTFRERLDAKLMLKEIMLNYTYPRLDINVSKQMNHLLKSPFVVHPKTGRVCVPIDPELVSAFDPAAVPTIGALITELNGGTDVRQTSLRQYTSFFETRFLQPLEAELAAEMRMQNSLQF